MWGVGDSESGNRSTRSPRPGIDIVGDRREPPGVDGVSPRSTVGFKSVVIVPVGAAAAKCGVATLDELLLVTVLLSADLVRRPRSPHLSMGVADAGRARLLCGLGAPDTSSRLLRGAVAGRLCVPTSDGCVGRVPLVLMLLLLLLLVPLVLPVLARLLVSLELLRPLLVVLELELVTWKPTRLTRVRRSAAWVRCKCRS